jgi:hypothetical protein
MEVWMFPEAFDNVALTRNSSTHQPGDRLDHGVIEVTYVVYDAAGNNGTCVFDIIVEDNEMPNITNCPTDVTLNTTRGRPVANYRFPMPMCMDNVGDVTVTVSKMDDEYGIGDTPVTIGCLDEAGNVETCTFTVTVEDVESPRLMMCPANLEAFADPGMNVSVTWTPPIAKDNSGSVSVSSNYIPGDQFMNGTYTVIYMAVDPSGNAASCNFSITVYRSDNLAPMVMQCPNDTTVAADLGVNFTVVTWPPVIINDNVDVTTLDMSHTNGSIFYIGSVNVSYQASDLAGNTASCNFTVTVIDTQAPVLTNCSDDIVAFTDLNSNGTRVSWDDPVVMENDVYTISQTLAPGYFFSVGNMTVTYYVEDRSGLNDTCEFLVTVFDNQPPVLNNCPINMEISTDVGVANATVFWTEPDAGDNVRVISVTNNSAPGIVVDLGETLQVVYVAYDAAGFNDSCQFEITVVDEEDPRIISCPDEDVVINATTGAANARAFWNEPTATDNSGLVTITAVYRPGHLFEIGSETNTYIALDEAGNTDECTFQIIVQDVEDPTLMMCPSDIDIYTPPNTNISVTWTQPIARDNSGDFTLSSNFNSGDRFASGTYTVIYTATDPSGNSVNCSFVIQVNSTDTNPPMISCPSDVMAPADNDTNSTIVTWLPPPYMDNFRVVSVNVSKANGSLFYIGSELVVYTVYDVVGNNDSCSFSVTVLDMQVPVITNCPSDINETTDPGQPSANISWSEPTVSDNSGSFSIDKSHAPLSIFPAGRTEVVYLVTDNSSNLAMCFFNITVTDDENPVFNCPSYVTNSTLPGRFVGTFSINPIPTDNVNVTYTNSTHQPGDELDVGNTTIEFYARDAAGNEAICQFIVTIEDDENPQIINCSSDIYANTSQGSNTAVVEWTLPVAMDNSGMVTLTNDSIDSGMYPIGYTVVTYNATDSSGNLATCQFTVYVTGKRC